MKHLDAPRLAFCDTNNSADSDGPCWVCGGQRSVHPRQYIWCPDCQHVWCAGKETVARRRAHAWGGATAFDRVRIALTRRRLHRLINDDTPYRVLELGFGDGSLARMLESAGHIVSGVDQHMLGQARHIPTTGQVWNCPVEVADLPENSFDIIIGIHIIEHLRDPVPVLRKCFRSLREGGVLYMITPNAASRACRLFGSAWWNFEDPTHVQFYSPASMMAILKRESFTQYSIRPLRCDSMSIESLSALRLIGGPSGRHGVLASTTAKVWAVGALPLTLMGRTLFPNLSPSMEVIAHR